MIRYALACAKGHGFESWFPDSAAYDKQRKRGLVSCPVCGDTKIDKAIMSPQLSGAKKRGRAAPPQTETPAQASDSPVAARDRRRRAVRAPPAASGRRGFV